MSTPSFDVAEADLQARALKKQALSFRWERLFRRAGMPSVPSPLRTNARCGTGGGAREQQGQPDQEDARSRHDTPKTARREQDRPGYRGAQALHVEYQSADLSDRLRQPFQLSDLPDIADDRFWITSLLADRDSFEIRCSPKAKHQSRSWTF
jgi:hypothetical protein